MHLNVAIRAIIHIGKNKPVDITVLTEPFSCANKTVHLFLEGKYSKYYLTTIRLFVTYETLWHAIRFPRFSENKHWNI